MTVVTTQSVSILDHGPGAPPMQRYQVQVVITGNTGAAPVVAFTSVFTDALQATAIFREHSSRALDRLDDTDWRRLIQFGKEAVACRGSDQAAD